MTVRKCVVVSGRVQGVFFRDTCRRRAQEVGVTGYVRNMPDGTVEACFEGAEDAVDRMIQWSRKGTDWSEVESVEVRDEEPKGDSSFSAR